MTTESNLERKLFKVQPSDLSGKHIAAALRDLKKPIKEAQEKLKTIPLKQIIDPMTGIEKWARFATAEELQKILSETCFGKVTVDTMPVMLNGSPTVVAYVLLTTEEGIVRLPGSFASQTVDVVSGEKALLWAETRACRRALRSIGLRAETDFYDGEELALQSKAEKQEVVEDKPTTQNAKSEKSSSTKSEPDEASKEAESGPAKGKKPPKKKASSVKEEKPPASGSLGVPKDALDITVDRDAPGFPNRRSSSYYNKLMGGLKEARKELGVSVDVFVRHVFGSEAFGDRKITLQSLTTEELEKMFQHYILDQESEI
jgi:hypothetical protein